MVQDQQPHLFFRSGPGHGAGDNLAAKIVAEGRGWLGRVGYLWGDKEIGNNAPNKERLDCSGFTRIVILNAGGPDIGFGTWHQREYCKAHGGRVKSPYKPADIVFLGVGENGPERRGADDRPVPSHVGLATGQGTILESTLRGNLDGVVETPDQDPVWTGEGVEAWRIL